MPSQPESVAHLSRRTRALLAIAGGGLILLVAAGVLLALNPAIAARLAGRLPGTAVTIDWTKGGSGSLRPYHASGMCLARDNNLVYNTIGNLNGLWPCTNDENRIWSLIPEWGAGSERRWVILTYKLLASGGKSAFALDVPNGTTDENASVISWPTSTAAGSHTDNQFWLIEDKGDKWYWIRNYSSRKCLSVYDQDAASGAGIVQRTCQEGDGDQWWQLDQ